MFILHFFVSSCLISLKKAAAFLISLKKATTADIGDHKEYYIANYFTPMVQHVIYAMHTFGLPTHSDTSEI